MDCQHTETEFFVDREFCSHCFIPVSNVIKCNKCKEEVEVDDSCGTTILQTCTPCYTEENK